MTAVKKKIIHFIYDLGRGGAETMVVKVINGMPEYEHVVVTLLPKNHFGDELHCDKLICINLRSLFFLPFATFKFRSIIQKEKPDLVHTHLFWPTTIARLTTPKRIPLVTTIHAFIATSIEYKKWFIRVIDKITFRLRKSVILADAKGALDEYFSFLKLTPYKAYCPYTFVDVDKFNVANIARHERTDNIFKVISVGALRLQKNQIYLVEAFGKIKAHPVELHIYGTGGLRAGLQKRINETGAKVILKEEARNIHEIIPQYDLFVMSSTYEGFSLAVLEAMAMSMPLLLSDVASFKEQCADTAVYFDLNNIDSLVEKLMMLSKMPKNELTQMGDRSLKRVLERFTLAHHLTKLRNIYTEALNDYQ